MVCIFFRTFTQGSADEQSLIVAWHNPDPQCESQNSYSPALSYKKVWTNIDSSYKKIGQ